MRIPTWAWLLAFALTCSPAAQAASPYDGAMTTLVMEYKASPANRAALRAHMLAEGLPQLEKWKREGRLRDYKVLFSRYVDNKAWDMLTLVNFGDGVQAARWKEIEQTRPAALAPAALALLTSVDSNPADQWFGDGSSKGNGVYLVIPYDYLVPTEKYISYLAGYLLPQLSGWMAEGALSKYNVYLGRYAVDRHWSALLVLEYNGEEGIAARERTTQKVRARLAASNPAWLAWSADKAQIRNTRQYILADQLTLP
jgi:hypothetical protein